MRQTPAVSYSVLRSRWHGRLIVLLCLVAMGVLVAFVWGAAQFDTQAGAIGGTLVISSAIAFNSWKKTPQGCLQWDGRHWLWSGFDAPHACKLSLILDFQSFMLVSVVGKTNATDWLWLEACTVDGDWKALRRAVVAKQAVSDGEAEAAEVDLKEHTL